MINEEFQMIRWWPLQGIGEIDVHRHLCHFVQSEISWNGTTRGGQIVTHQKIDLKQLAAIWTSSYNERLYELFHKQNIQQNHKIRKESF